MGFSLETENPLSDTATPFTDSIYHAAPVGVACLNIQTLTLNCSGLNRLTGVSDTNRTKNTLDFIVEAGRGVVGLIRSSHYKFLFST